MSVFLFIIGIIGIIWCLLPVSAYGVLNIGNATGLLVFALIAVYGIFRKKVNRKISEIWGKRFGKIVLSLFGLLILTVMVLTVIETICLFGTTKDKPKGNETVIVLGSYVSKAGPSVMAKCRLDKAVEYMDDNPNLVCVVTGGQGKDEPWPEADAMKKYMVEKGVSADRIYKEDKSKNTRENLLFAKQIIEDNNLNPQIAIVSNEFHLYRAGRIADRLGIEHSYISAPSPFEMFSSYYIRELYAVLADWFIYSHAGSQN